MSYFVGRASYARDMSVRQLLTPGKVEVRVCDLTAQRVRARRSDFTSGVFPIGNKWAVDNRLPLSWRAFSYFYSRSGIKAEVSALEALFYASTRGKLEMD